LRIALARHIRWEIRLCGRVAVSTQDGLAGSALPGRQGQLLLAYLVCHRTRACPRYELEDVLWPERAPAASDSALSSLLSKLRRALGPGALTGRAELRLALPEPLWVDIEALADTVEVAVQALDDRRWADAAAQARAALAVATEPFLAECDGPWVLERRREVEGLRLRALEALGEAGLRLGGRELDAAEHAARTAIGLAPFRESAHRLLMEIHEAGGNAAEALRSFDELRRLLRDELGTAPGPQVMALHERLLRGDAPPLQAPARLEVTPAPLPAALTTTSARAPFVGRSAELAALQEAWEAALGDDRRLVLLAGEPGIGKSRLAAEFARTAHANGAVVLHGRFDETGPGAYQPVLEMLRGWSGGAALTGPAQRLGPRAADLAALLPEFGVPAGPTAGAGLNEAGTERQRLFDALAALLAELAAGAPLLLVFDDLHWADAPTVQLLRHLVRAPQPRRTMFIGTYCDAELEDRHPLHELIATLRREDVLRHVELDGLEHGDVAALMEAHGADAPPSDLVSALHGETEGNAFFVEEVMRHLRDRPGGLEGAVDLEEAGVPEGVRAVTSRRIGRLPPSARDAVEVASVIGREFDFGLLEALGPLSGDDLVAALDEAVRARVLREVAGRVGRYAFAHALVRATLYDGLSGLHRARLHSRVGETILARYEEDLDPWLPQLARHFARAAAVDGPARAIEFALAAGRRADRLLAWEEAADHYRGAMRARQATSAGDETAGELLLALGASEERAGLEQARATFAEAASLARELADPVLLAHAALGVAGPWSTLGREDPEVVAVLEEALRGLGEEDSPLRARLLARLSLELYYAGQPERRLLLSEASVQIARRLGDPATLAATLDARHYVLWRPENVEERLEVAGELRRIAADIGDLELELEGAGWTVVDLLELGDVAGADVQIEAASALAAVVHRPLYLWWTSLFRCARAQLSGDFETAERLAGETLAIGQPGHAENALHYYAMAMFNIRREQGRLGEVEGAVAQFIEMYPAIPAWRCCQALMHVELGRPEEAREAFESVASAGFDALPRDANWLIAVTLLAEVCGSLGDADRAGDLLALLAPHGGRNVLVGRAASCNGSASRLLGILATVLGQWEEAERWFAEALEMHVRMGARPWLARTELAWAEMLLARGESGDDVAARQRLAEAIVLADALGMVAVAERARALVTGGEPVRTRA
jgi:DNA-binding SARP family transcriptional activator/tetratricopeptide (TPR) repeat protein